MGRSDFSLPNLFGRAACIPSPALYIFNSETAQSFLAKFSAIPRGQQFAARPMTIGWPHGEKAEQSEMSTWGAAERWMLKLPCKKPGRSGDLRGIMCA